MRFSKEDKILTDHLQEVFPEWLPEKPAPKVYLTPDMIHTIWEYAKKQNIDSDAIYRVLHYWCRGYRYHKAVSAYMLRYNETIKNTLDLLKKDYPKLFSAPNKPLKLDIYMVYQEKHSKSRCSIGLLERNTAGQSAVATAAMI